MGYLKERLKDGRTIFLLSSCLHEYIELLKWAREEKKCEWDEGTIATAAGQGNLEMVKYCVANKCPIGTGACAYAAENGHLALSLIHI